MRTSLPSRLAVSCFRIALTCLLFAGATGCAFFRNYGTGSRLDKPQEKTQKKFTAKAATMQFEVITDANGQVVQVQFIRSSGSNAVDNYVANSAKDNLAGLPSVRAVYEIEYKPGTGFSNPKLLSSAPLS